MGWMDSPCRCGSNTPRMKVIGAVEEKLWPYFGGLEFASREDPCAGSGGRFVESKSE